MQKIILITGASGGLGRELAIRLCSEGNIVYAATRSPEKLQLYCDKYNIRGLNAVYMDVCNIKSVNECVTKIIEREKGLDVLINNASYSILGAVEEIPINELKKIFDVNLYGYIRSIQSVLPHMRQAKRGIIINISSVSGVRASGYLSAYAMTKFSVEALSESLVAELQGSGIDVYIIEPGMMKTDMILNYKYVSKLKNSPYPHQVMEKINGTIQNLDKAQELKEVAVLINTLIKERPESVRHQTNAWSTMMVQQKLK